VTVHHERRGAVALLTIDRPERRNALDHATLDALLGALRDAADARVIVLTGTGGHFCAGADLSTVEDRGFTARLRQVLDALCNAPQPVIASVSGAALGDLLTHLGRHLPHVGGDLRQHLGHGRRD
jgi:enoyl-CoA hydratase